MPGKTTLDFLSEKSGRNALYTLRGTVIGITSQRPFVCSL